MRPNQDAHWEAEMKRLAFCIFAVLNATLTISAQRVPSATPPTVSEIPIELNRRFGAILIRAEVNGQAATLVVDTGSSNTILSAVLLHISQRPTKFPSQPLKGSGFIGSAIRGKATLTIANTTWVDRDVLVMNDFQDISNGMKQRIDGILGEDLLKEFAVIFIDFRHRRLVLSR